jgi:hypothetical protein
VSISEAYLQKSHFWHKGVAVPCEFRRYDRGWVVG